MAKPIILRLINLLSPTASSVIPGNSRLYLCAWSCHYSSATGENFNQEQNQRNDGKWFTLPPYTATINGSALGQELSGSHPEVKCGTAATTPTTALKWVIRCCPELPRNLVQKLFRIRQVRRESASFGNNDLEDQAQGHRLRRVTAKDKMNSGDQIFLPITVKKLPIEKQERDCSTQEQDFIRSLVLYKDPAIIVINKPPGMPVQGGIGIRESLDELARTCLNYKYPESPRLVHRLDKDSSGILVLGRTQISATILHSIFREKTSRASDDMSNINKKKRILQRRYWALVIGCPRRPKGLITAALGKVVLDNGKSDRITIVDNSELSSSQHAITEYRVIGTSSHGYTWLELSPLTGRKHQLRVHCAEILGTPIVGDYKYGWQAHRKMKHLSCPDLEENSSKDIPEKETLPFGLNLEKGSIFEKHSHLHLHCKQMVLPNVSVALQNVQSSPNYDLSKVESLELDAPLPAYMQRSWNTTNS
ncbi:RNA pseudouridine synthase 4 mitochondrial [Quillaja saponaria]|uniref:RNA pseudouridine synthase 4 mitochondrial n=1 Tax=Quillaja saponaria TaxID=32244 RepID=A0AAD7M076_QUISA|nr:RNA pseudouridine synthase 4 mitochondrial [Quillaja saponaria]